MDEKRNNVNTSRAENSLSREDIISALYKLEQKNIYGPYKELDAQSSPEKPCSKPIKTKKFLTEEFHPTDQDYLDEPNLVMYIREAAKDLFDLVERNNALSQFHQRETPKISNRSNANLESKEKVLEKVSQTINRFNEIEQKRRTKLAKSHFDKYQKELEVLQNKPQILISSKKIAESKGIQPIHERCQEVLKQKEDKLMKVKQKVEEKQKEIEQEATFRPSINNHKDGHKVRSSRELTDDLYSWYCNKKAAQESVQLELFEKEVKDFTFQPTICKKSKEISQKILPKEPVEERLLKFKDQKETKVQTALQNDVPPFKPVLNKTTLKIAQKIRERTNAYLSTEQDQPNLSYVDIKNRIPQTQRSTSPSKRSLTPNFTTDKQVQRKKNNSNLPHVTEIMYSPDVDFLLQRVKESSR